MSKNSLLDFVIEHATTRPNETAALVKSDGRYNPVTWEQMWTSSKKVASALVELGVQPEDRISIICHSRLEWVTCDLGILSAGGITVPIYPTNLDTECQYVLEHSGARVVFCENAAQVEKLIGQRDKLQHIIKVIQLDGNVSADGDWVLSMDAFLRLATLDEDKIQERISTLTEDSVLTIIYTAGTTGLPKGVVLTHKNMIFEGEAVHKIDVVRREDVQLFFLPLAHVFAKVLETAWLAVGYVVAFAENMNTIKANLSETQPHFMAGVPRVYERFYSAVVEKGMENEGLKKKMFMAALDLSQKNGEAELRGESLNLSDAIKFALLKKIIFKKIGESVNAVLGGRMRAMLSGGAPLSSKVNWFFRDAGITVIEGYGLTETSAGTCINRTANNHIGTVGPALPGVQLKIAEDGEVLVRGPSVMREYWGNKEATANSFDEEGWFLTGDIGEINESTGALCITDRKKDMLVTAGGKNVAPQKIENLFRTYRLISQMVVQGDRRKFLAALVTLDEGELMKLGQRSPSLAGLSYEELSQRPEVEKTVEAIIKQGNEQLPRYEQLKKFKILPADFSIETGELTPKLSIKRKVVTKKYQNLVDDFYTEKF